MLEELQKMQEEILRIQEAIDLKEEALEELKAKKKSLESKIELAVRVSKSYEESAQEKTLYDSEALATLYIKIKAQTGTALDDDLRQFADSTGLDLPEDLVPVTEEEAEEASATAA